MKFFYTIVFSILCITHLSAQRLTSDFLVTSAGDTLRGQVSFNKRLQEVRLKLPNQSGQTFTPTQAIAYGDETGPIRVSKAVHRQAAPKFLVPLLRGPVSLYSGENADGETRYFLQPVDSAYVVEIQPRTPRLAYLRVMPGCAKLDFSNLIIESLYRYNAGSLQQLVQTYNTCRFPQQASNKLTTFGGYRTHFGVKAGLNTTRFSEEVTGLGQPKAKLGHQAGLFLLVSSKRAWGLQAEVTYAKINSEYTPVAIYNGYATYTTTRAVEINYSQIQLPFLFRYTLPTTSWRPYVNAGPAYSFNFNRKSAEIFQDSDKPTPVRRPLKIPISNSIGAAAGVGILLPKPQLSVEGRLDYVFDPARMTLRLDVGLAF
ncbi:porin family protein [Hymenobacter sp. UYP22]|uniref:porin family protein n=1 Tax=Hymenobacter sp. UYP22 TaxID=3156348 RepID=UPI003390CD46